MNSTHKKKFVVWMNGVIHGTSQRLTYGNQEVRRVSVKIY
jgi:hypothetical protein